MRQQITVLSPCKINLSLQVVGSRPDGYHELRSVMQAVDVYNRLDICLDEQPGIRLVCDDPAIPSGPSNTAWRAAAAFFEALARAPAVCLLTKKSAPVQAGMGSASADAAGVLYGLNRLYGDPLDADALAALALSVGADVPFCLSGGTAFAQGLGERLSALPPMPDCGILLARPMVGYATAEMFARYDRLSPEGPKTPLTFEAACAALRAQSLCTLAPLIANDLERAAPDGAAAHLKRRLLDAGAAVAAMTGSGSAVFGLFESEREARKALESIRPAPFWAAVTKPVSGGPIQAEIA